MRCTSGGSRGSACATRFCTCTCALSRSVPSAKVTVSVMRAVGGRLREHVEHALDAVDLLLERRRHGLGDDLRVGAGIDRAHDDRRRHDARIFADRQPEQRERAGDDDQERQHGREDRPVDEEPARISCPSSLLRAASLRRLVARFAAPDALGSAGPWPSMATHRFDLHARPHALQAVDDDEVAVRCSPLRTTRRPSTSGPSVTGAVLDGAVGVDDEHEPLVEIGADGAVLDRAGRVAPPPGSRSRTNRPGVRLRSALRKTARPRIVPVAGSIWLSRKFILPFAREVSVARERHADRQGRLRALRAAASRAIAA